MRDILLTLTVIGSLPFILKRPWLGALMWVWISVMNPHRLTWGFAYDMPFGAMVAIATLLSLVFSKEKLKFPVTPLTFVFMLFVFWMSVTTLFALQPDQVWAPWEKVMKTMLMTMVVIAALHKREHIDWLVWVLVVSLGYYGVKGGFFTIRWGGGEHVYGPTGSFIEENNALAVAICMLIPLVWYVRLRATDRRVKHGALGAMCLCAVAVFGSQSRGALLTIVAMTGFLWLKSRQKLGLLLVVVLMAPMILSFMPEKWHGRMSTIQTYDEDESAMGRINAWQMAFNLAKDRPLVGGGFEIYDPLIFARYAPVPDDVHAAHSIYFAALGEHGFVGLGLFLVLGVLTWRTSSWIAKSVKGRSDLRWAADLAQMCQVSIVGYAVGGGLLSLLYFDLPYYIMGLLVMTRRYIQSVLADEASVARRVPGSKTEPVAGSLATNSSETA